MTANEICDNLGLSGESLYMIWKGNEIDENYKHKIVEFSQHTQEQND